jgi:hypothetical protein
MDGFKAVIVGDLIDKDASKVFRGSWSPERKAIRFNIPLIRLSSLARRKPGSA